MLGNAVHCYLLKDLSGDIIAEAGTLVSANYGYQSPSRNTIVVPRMSLSKYYSDCNNNIYRL